MVKKITLWQFLLLGLCFFSCSKSEFQYSQWKSSDSTAKKLASSAKIDHHSKSIATPEVIADTLVATGWDMIEGKYATKTCNNGIFFIVIEGIKKKEPVYKIFDEKKMIAKGNLQITQDDKSKEISVIMGDMQGKYDNEVISIQNIVSNINPLMTFKKCDARYIDFTKS